MRSNCHLISDLLSIKSKFGSASRLYLEKSLLTISKKKLVENNLKHLITFIQNMLFNETRNTTLLSLLFFCFELFVKFLWRVYPQRAPELKTLGYLGFSRPLKLKLLSAPTRHKIYLPGGLRCSFEISNENICSSLTLVYKYSGAPEIFKV